MSALSSPFSTGGGGHNFENHVQAAFVILMLTGGVAPCLRPWPIKSIKLQGHYEDLNTDDLIVFVEEQKGSGKAKLLAQIKYSLSITENDKNFSKVIRAAWLDFGNNKIFDPNNDIIALITGPLSATDNENARRILEWARTSATSEEFFKKVDLAKFSSDSKREKLRAFRAQLKKANDGVEVDNETLWLFLKRYYIVGYDLDIQSGVTLSLLNSHIAQFNTEDISGTWSLVAKEVSTFNQNSGTITTETLSEEIRTIFSSRTQPKIIPTEFIQQSSAAEPDITPNLFTAGHGDALALASLLGGWNDNAHADKVVIAQLVEGHD